MPTMPTREFRVHARHIDHHHARVIREASFEAAAIAFLDDYSHALGDDPAISLVVHELGSGYEHCFRIDLGSGDVTVCD